MKVINEINTKEVESAIAFLALAMGQQEGIEWEYEGEQILVVKGNLARDILKKARIIDCSSS